ncbi:MAG: ABC transporter permease [Candidatus Verstraetearchaeota archaeon]|nr:ABC transporter permease [Candidatus Verstraetearchaeota archaeon]
MSVFVVVIKELKQFRRDPRSLIMIAMIPLIVMVLFGIGYGGEKGKVNIGIVNLDKEALSWTLIDSIMKVKDLNIKAYGNSIEEGRKLVEDGKVSAVIVIPSGFTYGIIRNSSVQLLVIVDESIPTMSSMIKSSILYVTYKFQEELSLKAQGNFIEIIYNSVYGPTVTNIEAFTPLVMGIVLQLVPTTLISIAICREKEKGTFEQLIMSPISKFDIIFGKFIAFFIATIANMLITLLVAIYVFNVSIKGSIIDAMLISTLFLIGSLGLGMLISVLSRNQLQANQAAIFVFIPALLFSGTFVPIDMLSYFAKIIANLTPMYYFTSAFRDIMIRGASIWDVSWQTLVLTIYVILMLAIALKTLKLRVD